MNKQTVHPAEFYRQKKAHIFSIVNKHGWDKAFYVLETFEKEMDKQAFIGLKMEFFFAKENNGQLKLTPTLDCGDHCDFVGLYKGDMARFDVTSNLSFKNLKDYEKHQTGGQKYFIAVMDQRSGKVDGIIDINFPICPECGGKLVNIALFGDEEYTTAGTLSKTQKTMTVCSSDHSHVFDVEVFNFYMHTFSSINTFLSEFSDHMQNPSCYEEEIENELKKHGINTSLYFSKLTGNKIHACGEGFYKMTDKEGGGYWSTRIGWMADIIDQLLPSEIDNYLLDF